MKNNDVMKMSQKEIQNSFDRIMKDAPSHLVHRPTENSFSHFERVSKLKDTNISYSINSDALEG